MKGSSGESADAFRYVAMRKVLWLATGTPTPTILADPGVYCWQTDLWEREYQDQAWTEGKNLWP